ncbi:MAG: flavin reductase family protein [Ruminococcaceae bacterium]|nr:flavin reductase family protein [Oscillospiraceae bacterium]
MEKIKWRGGTLLAPVPPVLVTCADGERKNVLTVAWTGIINSDPPKTYISVRPSRYSYEIIKKSGVFAINLTNRDLVRAADWCGVCTGAKNDKFAKCNLSYESAKEIDCPILSDSPVVLECRVTDVVALGSHDMFLADIVAVDVNETLVDDTGKLHLEKAELVAYAHGDYYELGKRLGHFGFSVAKKKKKPRVPDKSKSVK